MRLDKYIRKSTEYCLADTLTLINNNRVMVNDEYISKVSHQVHKNSIVTLDGKKLTPRPFRYFLLNKPVETICSNVDEKYPTVLRLLDVDRVNELHIAGRLDVDTTGLILITDDGHWTYNLTLPNSQCEKVYKVLLSRPISHDASQRFRDGILLDGEATVTLPAKLDIIDSYNVCLTITEGRFHQVKRMFAAIGNRVQELHRQQIGKLELDVAIGEWRSLTQTEVNGLSINFKADCR